LTDILGNKIAAPRNATAAINCSDQAELPICDPFAAENAAEDTAPSRIRLQGSGAETIITKIASETVPLTDDSD